MGDLQHVMALIFTETCLSCHHNGRVVQLYYGPELSSLKAQELFSPDRNSIIKLCTTQSSIQQVPYMISANLVGFTVGSGS